MIDGCGREIDHLRLSLTDHCNLACRYCVPEGAAPDWQMIDVDFAFALTSWLTQQHGIRPGTENVPGAVGMGRAVELAASELAVVPKDVAALRDTFESRIRDVISDVVVHGAVVPRGPNISCMSFPGTSSESMMAQLDLGGVACSTGAACTSGAVEPSHVLEAMGVPRELALTGVRFSFGHQNTEDEVERAVIAVQIARKKAKRLSGVLGRA